MSALNIQRKLAEKGLRLFAAADRKSLYNELKTSLPKSHWAIIQRLPDQLIKELHRL
jgi:hypothetical protein